MTLPDLPRQLKRKEAKSAIDFRHKMPKLQSCTLEMKDTLGKDSLPFSAVTDDQIAHALGAESDKGILIRNTGGSGEPDYTYHRNQPAYIVIKYPAGAVGITIGNFLFEKERSKRKSLTWERAQAIASFKIK